jgi:NAD(P)H-quinone oxidoreductase subunit 5
MMQALLSELPTGRTALMAATPLFYLLAAAGSWAPTAALEPRWRLARWCAAAALASAALSLVWVSISGAGVARFPVHWALGAFGTLHMSLRSDALGALMQLLVGFIGWVIVGYSQPYLGGERGQPRYIRGLMLTLACVSLLVLSNNLVLLAAAWIGTSLALHGLLTFFDKRAQAVVAAHKKFIASRVADVCLLGAIVLVGQQLGTLEIDEAMAAVRYLPTMSGALQAAAVLLATSALIKCAQLPVHGWLIQVMEAPTPVSALLHAGVVNLGGFLLIRLGSLVGAVPMAQALLVIVGSVTAVAAALVMTTRISIKVSLAWSTCAQMGFMMVQCGLGLYDLALLHLVAHSLYKAHAFLGAGSAVAQNRLQQMAPPPPPLFAGQWLLGALLGMVLVAAAALVWGFSPTEAPALWPAGVILSLALVPLVVRLLPGAGGGWRLLGPVSAFAVALAYFGLHAAFSRWLGAQSVGAAPSMALVVWVLGCFALLFFVQGVVRVHPQGALARGLYPWLFAGFYLDEVFTRLTFRVWPARTPNTPGTLTRPVPRAHTPGDL